MYGADEVTACINSRRLASVRSGGPPPPSLPEGPRVHSFRTTHKTLSSPLRQNVSGKRQGTRAGTRKGPERRCAVVPLTREQYTRSVCVDAVARRSARSGLAVVGGGRRAVGGACEGGDEET